MMNILLTMLLSLYSLTCLAQSLIVDSVVVDCPKSNVCTERKGKLKNIEGEYRSLVHLKDTIRLMASDGGYRTFTYELQEVDGKNVLSVKFLLKPTINEISIGFLDRNLESDPKQLLTLREGEYFEEQKLKQNVVAIPKKLEALGYPNGQYQYEVVEKENKVDINVVITLNEPLIFKSIKTNSSSQFIRNFLRSKFNKFYDKPFEQNRFKVFLDEAQKELFSYGYYLINLEFTPLVKGRRVILNINVSNDSLFAFDFENLQREHHFAILNLLSDLLRKFKKPLSESAIKQAISEHYEKMALLNVNVQVTASKFVTKFKEVATLYRIKFDEGFKTRLVEVDFQGNVHFKTEKLKSMFRDEAFELASIKYYDQEYFEYFAGFLKNKYIGRGFVQARIVGPINSFDHDKKTAAITYNIQEGQRAFLRSISFDGLPPQFEEELIANFKNKIGKPFNPITFAEDVKSVTTLLQNRGYYFSEVTNATEDSIVSYSKSGSDVEIMIAVNPGPLVVLNRILVIGNSKTRKKVILKKILMEKGDLVTPNKTKEIEAAISSTGLFNSVSVSPVRHNSKKTSTDLIVRLVEREYGLLEVAPGYRTDLGLKLSSTASYTNIGGANRSVTVNGQVNQRISYAFFDPRRRKEKKKVLEYLTTFNFTQGDMFDTLVDYNFGLTVQKKRFYAFDGDIARVNNTFTRDFTKRFSGSIRHQYEQITQTDASVERERGSFKIGAFTPSLTYDMRNSQIVPVKGAFFNLSCEFANPYFLSQKTSQQEINYYKLLSRNRFYIPFKNGTVAISLVSGVQENLAKDIKYNSDGSPQTVTDEIDTNGNSTADETLTYKRTAGYIPNIKVFRLTGMDIVRGFTDEEINRLPNKYDISDIRVQNRAFLTNFKFEPRYFINDALMAGVFYDAGRVQVDQVDYGDLRSSVGVTFKVITPVGTLDFDYGIKLLRKRNQDGTLESPGRFHVSIGFF